MLMYFSLLMMKDFGTLVGSQYSSANNKTYFCRICLHRSSSHSATRGKAHHLSTKFENIQKQVQAPFTVYADFESILKQLSAKNISLVLTLIKLLVTWN